MLDAWQIQTLARTCRATGEAFEIGDKAICLIFRNAEGTLDRADLKPEALDSFDPESPVLGRWSRIVKSQQDEAKEAQKQQTASLEEFFLSLFEPQEEALEEDAPELQDVDSLKQILALQLERKRILKRQTESPTAPTIQYLHSKSKKTYTVPNAELSPDQLIALQEQLMRVC